MPETTPDREAHPSPSTCTMPRHGDTDAPDACCRPAPDLLPSTATSAPRRLAFWRAAFWRDGPTWRRAAHNTLHCLIGCALGDIAAMSLVPVWWPEVPLAALMAIAIAAGLLSSLALETAVLRVRERMPWRRALRTALGMSLLSMVGMELAMNATDLMVMGGQRMPLDHLDYWLAWLPALAVGFLLPLPYNYRQLRRHGRSCH
ncbi:MAG: DUF4396 domain-containing protein [Planctomycetota bacterium]